MQRSHPWGYLVGADSAVGYTAKEDSALYAMLARAGGIVIDSGIRTLGALANRGVFYSVDNKLAVTNPGGAANRIDVDTGSALVCGIEFDQSGNIGAAGDITSPVANPRIDRVVVRANFSAAAYVPASASAALFTVPPNTARVTIIHGAEAAGPVAPALTQDVNRTIYWDIPLYQYQISVGGAITALTDEREWADAETKQIMLHPVTGYNNTDGVAINMVNGRLNFIDSKDCEVTLPRFIVPSNFLSSGIIEAVVLSLGPGNLRFETNIFYGACGTGSSAHGNDTIATTTYAVVQNIYECIASLSLASLAPGDIVSIIHERHGDDVLDTINTDVYYHGAIFTYLGWN